eukprot:CAMPEP_0202897630 /NCGR_PEP_ID=MMETSP1392-20130828/6339_1 /ASSEMBLY_ACC=CAM_ASM_000868 /TAXON_ID=225041 /ORGANISM="Chlamydomonas chlamydogama, Strain SAG 11-48b" /LENGTH=530 /DNA_ID=CAMNT_0049583315 /DNA_START=464 /DNA_END=2056 /DNA_ORIENTATION=+
MEDIVDQLAESHKETEHLSVGCLVPKLHETYFINSNYRIMWAALDAIRPSDELMQQSKAMAKSLSALTDAKSFNFLHLRMEDDFAHFCQQLVSQASPLQHYCSTTTDQLLQMLNNLNVPRDQPLYVAAAWHRMQHEAADGVLKALESVGYNVHTAASFKDIVTSAGEEKAVVEFELAMQAGKMIGHGLSNFSSLAIVQRRNAGLWAAHYNGGPLPLGSTLPVDQLPWVFAYNTDSPNLDYLVRAAVRSALRYRVLRPICIWTSNVTTGSPIYDWMVSYDVQIVQHRPAWTNTLWDKLAAWSKTQSSKPKQSFLMRPSSLLRELVSVDLPQVPELEQYSYVLYTSPAIFFYNRVSLMGMPQPLPEVLTMVADPSLSNKLDSGVMLMHLPGLRESYREFMGYLTNNKQGSGEPSFMLGAHGVFTQFYKQNLLQDLLPLQYAAKPYAAYDSTALIVHFEGPRPHDYMHFFYWMECAWGNSCEQAFKRGLCSYMHKWHSMLNETEDDIGLGIWYGCNTLYAPHLRDKLCMRYHV